MDPRLVRLAQYQPPAPPRPWIQRQILASRGSAAVSVFVGGPGCGKSCAMLQAFKAPAPPGGVATWLGLVPADAAPPVFFSHVVAALGAYVPEVEAEASLLASKLADDPARLWGRLFELLARAGVAQVRLAIDNAHHVPDRPGDPLPALVELATRLPGHVDLLIATRHRPAFAYGPLAAGGAIHVVPEERLMFSTAETRAFLAEARAPVDLPADWRRALVTVTGWPLGIALIAASGRESEWQPGRWDERLVADAILADVLQRLAPERLELLLHVSLLAEITAEACGAVFGTAEAAPLLAALAEDSMLIAAADGSYRLHDHVRDALAARARRTFPPERLQCWHRLAADHYLAGGRMDAALAHLAAAQAWQGFARAAVEVFPILAARGRVAQIRPMLEAVPPAVRAADPGLQIWYGRCLLRDGAVRDALLQFNEALRQYRAAEDAAGEGEALVRLAEAQFYGGFDEGGVERLLDAAEPALPRMRADVRVDYWHARLTAATHAGRWQEVERSSQAILAEPAQGNPLALLTQAQTLLNLHIAAMRRGDLDTAERYLVRSRHQAEAVGAQTLLLLVTVLQADFKAVCQDLPAADALIAQVPPFWRDVVDSYNAGTVLEAFARWHALRGELDEAERAATEAVALYEDLGHAGGRLALLEQLAGIVLARGRPERAIALAHARTDPGADAYAAAGLGTVCARAYLAAGRAAEAVGVLERAIETFTALGARLKETEARLELARAQEALDLVGAAAQRARARALIEEGGYHWLARERSAPVAGNGAAQAGNGLLELRVLGGFEVRVGDKVISHWPRRKARWVLAALVLSPDGVPAADLASLIGGEAPASDASVQAVVAALRRALEPELGKRATSRYVRFERGLYVLDWRHVKRCDLATLREEVARGDAWRDPAPAQAISAYEQALAAFGGELFDDPELAAPFAEARREVLAMAMRAAGWLADHASRRGDPRATARVWQHLAERLPTTPEPTRLWIEALNAAGETEAAREAYWRFRRTRWSRGLVPRVAEVDAAYRRVPGADI